MNLVGLAFSGGGIRSATFNLGVLQGLAEQKLLKHVDYLSTVSGGGFIGSWFTALVRRQKDGVRQVENVLQPIRRDQSAFPAERGNSIENRQECEPEPIAHLLACSNYLAPKLGMLSPDTLSLVAAYVRNLVANLLVLIPALVACIALIRLGHAGFLSTKLTDIRCAPEIAAVLTVALLIAALLLMGTAVGRIRCIRRHQKKEQVPVDQQYHLPTGIYTWTVVLLMLGAISAVWLLSSRDHLTGLWGADLSSLQEQIHTVSLFFATLAVVSYLLQEL